MEDYIMELSEIIKLNNVCFEFVKFLNSKSFVNDSDFVIIMDNLNTYHNICKTKSPKITYNTFISSDAIKVCNLKLNNLENKTQQDNKKMSLEFLLYIKSLYIKYIERIQNDNNSNNLSNLSLIFLILESIRNILVNYNLDQTRLYQINIKI